MIAPIPTPPFYFGSRSTRLQLFRNYCKEAVAAVERGQLTREQAAYNICGATRYDELAAVPELDEIIDMACELEIPAKQRKDKVGWSDLASAIGELPDSLRAS